MDDQDFTVICRNCHSKVMASELKSPETETYDNFICPVCITPGIPVEEVWMDESYGDMI